MLVLEFVDMSPLMLNLILISASVVEVCFLCFEVSCYEGLIMENMMLFSFYFVPQKETLLSNFATFWI